MDNLFTQEILDMLQGPALLQLLNNPAELRSAIVALESAIDLLKDNEQRLYPEQAPKAGRSKRNEAIIDTSDPAWQRDKILRVFQRTHQALTPVQLHGQYIKSVDAALLDARCDELVDLGELAVLSAKRGDGRKYCLPSDVPPEPEPTPYKPITRLLLGGREAGIYIVIQGFIDDLTEDRDRTPAYLVNGDDDLAHCYKHDSDRLMDVPRNVVVPMGTKDYDVVSRWAKSSSYEFPFPAKVGYFPKPTEP